MLYLSKTSAVITAFSSALGLFASGCAVDFNAIMSNLGNPPPGDTAPLAVNVSPPTFNEDVQSIVSLSYTDADSDQATSCTVSNLVNATVTQACACTLGNCTVGITVTSTGAASFDYTVTANSNVSPVATATLSVTPVDDAPVVSAISPAALTEDTQSIITLPYTDEESNAATACAVTPVSGVTITQACACAVGVCTVGITGTSNTTGAASFTYTVTANSQVSNSATATLSITAVNDPPTISNVANQTTAQDTTTGAISFTINDVDSALVCNATSITRASTNTTVLPLAGIAIGGTAPNCTVTLTPGAGQSGSSTVTLTVSDGVLTANDTFDLTVTGGNTPPTITGVATQTILNGYTAATVTVTVGDTESGAAGVTVTGASSVTSLIANNQIRISGTGATRTIEIGSIGGQSGSSTITLTASDGVATTPTTFTVNVTSSTGIQAPLMNGNVNATLVSGSSVYIGGSFTAFKPERAGGVLTLNAANGNQATDFLGGIENNASVLAIATDGTYAYLGGNFTTYRGMAAQRIVKVNLSTGEMDPAFSALTGFNGSVSAIAISGAYLYVGGSFTTYRGISAQRLAKIAIADGALDTTFTTSPGVSGAVYAVTTSGTDVYFGGSFSTYRGATAQNLAKVAMSNGLLDGTFTGATGTNGAVNALLVNGASLYVGGNFTTYRGSGAPYLFKAGLVNGALDAGFNAGVGPNAQVRALAAQGTSLYVGGEFTTYVGSTARAIAKASLANGAFDAAFAPTLFPLTTSRVDGLSTSATALYIAGNSQTLGGVNSPWLLAKVDLASGITDATFTQATGPNYFVYAVQTTGSQVLVGGSFTTYRGTRAFGLAKTDLTLQTLDTTFTGSSGVTSPVNALAVNGTDLYVGGTFKTYRGVPAGPLMKVSTVNGNLDTTFTLGGDPATNIDGSGVNALVADASGLFVGGSFYSYRSVSAQNLMKVDYTNGNYNTTFQPSNSGPNGEVLAMVIAGGALHVGGDFTQYRGFPQGRMTKLNITSGVADTSFTGCCSGAGSPIRAMAASGTALYVGGDFTTIRSTGVQRIAKINLSDGSLDTTFTGATGFPSNVYALVLSGSSIYAAGQFTSYRGTAAQYLAKLDSTNGALDTTFTESNGLGGVALSLSATGANLVVGGVFTTYRSAPAPHNLTLIDLVTGAIP